MTDTDTKHADDLRFYCDQITKLTAKYVALGVDWRSLLVAAGRGAIEAVKGMADDGSVPAGLTDFLADAGIAIALDTTSPSASDQMAAHLAELFAAAPTAGPGQRPALECQIMLRGQGMFMGALAATDRPLIYKMLTPVMDKETRRTFMAEIFTTIEDIQAVIVRRDIQPTAPVIVRPE